MTASHPDERPSRALRTDVDGGARRRLRRLCVWIFGSTFVSGFAAFLWLLLRTGNKPSRITYPCQQAALAAATQAFGVSLVALLLATRRGLAGLLGSPLRLAAGVLGIFVCIGLWTHLNRPFSRAADPGIAPPADYRAQVYHVENCPQDPVAAHFVGLDNLVLLMGHKGLKFYRSSTESLVAGPGGIVGAADVVLIKINYQWSDRGGTNVDLLRGLVQRIVEHPGGFSGEIVICENTQFASSQNFDRSRNNAQDPALSPHDVVREFEGAGYRISVFDWTPHKETAVQEFSAGDPSDGYLLYPYDQEMNARLSYPKFTTRYGTCVSLRHGIWDPDTSSYSKNNYTFINVPVLKSHHAFYGATACVKNYMGVVTGYLNTWSHAGIRWGLLGRVLGEIGIADLNILDCIWVNANPHDGPGTTYSAATRRDELVASVDPVAADVWAVKNILLPAFVAGGYSEPWPVPSADPEDPGSAFREYLDNSMNEILAAGFAVTNDLERIDAHSWDGSAPVDSNGNGVPDEWEALGDHCFMRGNINARHLHSLDIGDVVDLIHVLFDDLSLDFDCAAALDVNNDGRHNILDPVALVQGVFFPSRYTIPPPAAAPALVDVDGGSIPSALGCLEGEGCP